MINKDIINYYNHGYELSSDDQEFPKWFETYQEKVACLLGFNDFTIGIYRTEEEIIKEINKIFGN